MKKTKFKLVLFCMLLLCAMIGFLACGNTSEEVYSVHGVVTVDGETVSGVEISVGDTRVTTDENGEFLLQEMSGVNYIKISAPDDVYFPSKTVQVYKSGTNVVFEGSKYYEIRGKVVSEGVPVPSAVVKANGILSVSTQTNILGEFVLPNLAGTTSIVASQDGDEFFAKTVDKNNSGEIITINGYCNISGTVICNEEPVSGVVVTDGLSSSVTDAEGRYFLVKVKANSVISASKTGYQIPEKKAAEILDGGVNFEAFEIYSKSGVVKSGDTLLSNIQIKAVGVGSKNGGLVVVSETNENGEYELNGLYGETEIKVVGDEYKYMSEDGVNFEACYDVIINTNLPNGTTVSVLGENYNVLNGIITIFNVNDSQTVDPINSDYYITPVSVQESGRLRNYNYKFQKYYDLVVNTACEGKTLENVRVYVDGSIWDGQTKLYGERKVSVECDGYSITGSQVAGVNNSTLDFTAQKYYKASGNVTYNGKSVDAEIYAGDVLISKGDSFEYLSLNPIDITIKSDKYKDFICNFDSKSDKDFTSEINLVYKDGIIDVEGNIFSNDKPVADAQVSCGDEKAVTDSQGHYKLFGIKDNGVISASKEGYEFVANGNNFEAYACYAVSGTVKSGTELLANEQVRITNQFGLEQTVTTDVTGGFTFAGAFSDCSVEVVGNENLIFESFSVSSEANLTFNGTFSVEIEIYEDGRPVVAVTFAFAGRSVTTDANGRIVLAGVVLSDELELSAKNYEVTLNSKTVDGTIVIYNYNVSEFYNLSGIVEYNNTYLEGVIVSVDGFGQTVTDSNGKFNFNQVHGNVNVEFVKDGYFIHGADFNKNSITQSIAAFKKFSIAGKVMFDNKPLSNASVNLGGTSYELDSNGEFIANGIYGEVEFAVSCDGYIGVYGKVTENNKKPVLFILGKEESGKITTGKIGVSGAQVEVINKNVSVHDGYDVMTCEKLTSVTDANGRFTVVITEETTQNYTVSALKTNYQFTASGFDISATYEISGKTIINNADGSEDTVSGVSIVVKDETKSVIVDSDGSGKFTCNGIVGEAFIFPNRDLNGEKVDQSYEFDPSSVSTHGEAVVDIEFIHGSYSLSGKVVSGGIPVANAMVKVGNSIVYSDESGEFFFDVLSGTKEIIVTKDGYGFTNEFVSAGTKQITITGTYSVSGKIVSGGLVIPGVDVYVNGVKIAVSDKDGYFEIPQISGKNEITFVKAGYCFDILNVEEPCNNTIDAPYNYSVKAVTGDVAVEDVEVWVNGEFFGKTDSDGNIMIKLHGESVITLSKNGFIFENEICVNAPDFTVDNGVVIYNQNEVNSSYTFEGKIKTGSLALTGVEVKVGTQSVYTDSDGYFKVSGIIGARIVSFEKADCDFGTVIGTISGYIENFEITATYFVGGLISSGDLAVSGVDIYVNGKKVSTCESNGNYVLDNLSGESVIEFVKEGYNFGESRTFVEGNSNFNISATYTVSGFINTDGIGVVDAIVDIGGNSVKTDADGKFTINKLSGKNPVSYSLNGHVFNGISSVDSPGYFEVTSTYSVGGTTVSGDCIVPGVVVFDNGVNVFTTGKDGKFAFENVSGKHVFTFEKDGYVFDSVTISQSDNLILADSSYSISGFVKTGNTAVGEVKVSTEFGDVSTAKDGSFTLDGIKGTVSVSFEKNGYSFTDKLTNGYLSGIEIQGTYMFKGIIKTGTLAVEGVVVFVNGTQRTVTDSEGAFEISGLSGESEVEFNKHGYEFTYDKAIDQYTNKNISSVYNVTLKFVSGENALGGMNIGIGDKTETTDTNGVITLNGVSGKFDVTIIKNGYTFEREFDGNVDGILCVDGAGDYIFSGTYEVRGFVKNGNSLFLDNVTVSNGNLSVVTDVNGEFILKGLTGTNNLTFTKTGYVITEIKVDDYEENLIAKATYDVELSFINRSDSENSSFITISFKREGGAEETMSAKLGETIKISGVSGVLKIKYEGRYLIFNDSDYSIYSSKGYDYFKQNGYFISSSETSEALSLELGAKYDGYYYVSGKVTGNGVAMEGIKVSASGYETLTNADGTFKFSKPFDKYDCSTLTPTYSILKNGGGFTGISYNNPKVTIGSSAKPDDTYNLTCLATGDDLGAYLVWKAYENLKTVNTFESSIIGHVDATPESMAGIIGDVDQDITGYKKKDANGNIETLYLNYGKDVNILGIVVYPQTGLYSFSNVNTANNVYYKYTKTVSRSGSYPNHVLTPTWSDTKGGGGISGQTNATGYRDLFYVDYTNLARYVISQANINSCTVSGNGNITVTVNYKYDGNGYALSQYFPQMKKFSGQDPTIDGVTGKYVIDKNGNLSKVVMEEKYHVVQVGVKVNCVSTLNETFKMNMFSGSLNVQK